MVNRHESTCAVVDNFALWTPKNCWKTGYVIIIEQDISDKKALFSVGTCV